MNSPTEELSTRKEIRIQHTELISLLHSHFHAVGQAALACNNHSCTIGYTTQQFVSIVKTLAKLYFYIAYLSIVVKVYETFA